MNKLIQYSLTVITATSLLVTSCTKKEVVDLTPEFNLDALTNPSNLEQVEQVLLGAYGGFRSNSYYGDANGGGWATLPDMMSDNLIETNESLANYRVMSDWLYNEDATIVQGLFTAPYVIIGRANIVLRDVDKFATAENQKKVNRIKGQALAIRAHAHFDLLRFFGQNFSRNSTELAVPYLKEFLVSTAAKPARPTVDNFYTDLFADLTTAQGLLADVDVAINPAGEATRSFIDLAGVYAIQARAYLYAGMWGEAETAATNAINLRPLVTIGNDATFQGMYNGTAAGEIIWNVQFDAGQGGPGGSVYFAQNNRSGYAPVPEIATSAGTSGLIRDNDMRYDAFFQTLSGPLGNRLVVFKYAGKNGLTDGNANFPVYRTGEMYLIRAEARARNSKPVPAMQDLNFLRANRIAGYADESLSGDALLNAIQNERRRELVAEGHRFFDLKRTTKTITRTTGCGNPAITPSGECTLVPTDREWNLPIPFAETNVNGNMQPNPGYNQ